MPSDAPLPTSLDVSLDVETPEQVLVSYSIAGIGSRAAAALVDAVICVVLTIISWFLIASVIRHTVGLTTVGKAYAQSTTLVIATVVIIQFIIFWGYYVLVEGMYDGQTPGKRLFRLRVVRDGGYSISFGASAVRNLVRVIDMQPAPTYLVGIVTTFLNRSNKRLGDLVAGTFVVREAPVPAAAPVTAVAPSAAQHVMPMLSDDEYELLERYVQRRQSLSQERRQQLIEQLAKRFERILSPDVTAAEALIQLYENERATRSSNVASRSDTGVRREQHAIVAFGMKRWNDFSVLLDRAKRTGLKNMSAAGVSAFVGQYRELTTDYARLQTAARGRPSDALFYLSRLVARGHSLVYRQRSTAAKDTGAYLIRTVPAEIRRSWRPILLAAAITFGPAFVTYGVVMRYPKTIERLMPDEMISRATTATAREKRGEGYVTITEEERPIAASMIITNNVKVTYLAFAMGITAGIGTILVLLTNGVMLGASYALFSLYDVTRVLSAFIAPHGVLELSAICIGGGGGLLLASALVFPGRRTRREALVENGKRAIALVAGASVLLVVAGTIEGMISPRVWPLSWKLGVSSATAILLAMYVLAGRRAS